MRSVHAWLTLPILGACSFTPVSSGVDPDGGPLHPDAPRTDATDARVVPGDDVVPMPFVPLHVPPAGAAPGTADLVLTAAVDTSALTIGGSATLPSGVTFDAWPQPTGPALAVLHVRGLRIPSGATVTVTGSRAFVVVASNDIDVIGVLDGGAKRNVPGPGGAAPDSGTGKGLPGLTAGTFPDSGGSGAGFGGPGGGGGRGAATSCGQSAAPVTAGASYGDPSLSVLLAGSGGGTAATTSCGVTPAGAGGGAIQLSSATTVAISGGINVGGGGGGGGRAFDTNSGHCDMSAGSGAGSGGAIVLQAPTIQVLGVLAANGGAGGSAAGDPNGDDAVPTAHGVPGQDGALSSTGATPGPDVGVWSAAGGAGGAKAVAAGAGAASDECSGNGGGGGGAVGRIVLAHPATGSVTVNGVDSPSAVQVVY